MERIVSSAVKFKFNGNSHNQILCAKRHSTIFKLMHEKDFICDSENLIQGFFTNTDRFVDRRDAVYIARAAGQVPISFEKDFLYSEDIWPD